MTRRDNPGIPGSHLARIDGAFDVGPRVAALRPRVRQGSADARLERDGAKSSEASLNEPVGSWLPRYRRRHVWIMAPLSLAVAALSAVPLPLSEGTQLVVLAVAVTLFGLPHGALDHLVGRRLLHQRLGSRWPLLFFPVYLALAAAVLLLWWAAPRLMLAAFLAYSVWHFGAGDLAEGARRRQTAHLLAAARGLLPLTLPAVFHTAEVTRYFNWLLPGGGALTETFVRTTASLGALASISLLVALVATRAPGAPSRLEGVELSVLTLLFIGAPPLVSFLVYFCGWHSARHLLELGAELAPGDPRAAAVRLWRSSWPLTMATAAGAYPVWLLLRAAGTAGDVALGQVLFIGLAALTVPHMILGSLARRRAAEDGTSE